MQYLNGFWQQIQQAKGSLEKSLQATGELKNTTSAAIKTVISQSVSDWLLEHPLFLQLMQILSWATNHPIISFIILIFLLAIFWSIVKAIGRLIESASLSVVKLPWKLLQILLKFTFLLFNKVSSLGLRQLTGTKPTLPPVNPESKNNQHRLLEISQRLEEIHAEQNQLLQEVAEILSLEKNHSTTKLHLIHIRDNLESEQKHPG